VNIDDRLRAASRALKESSIAQVDAATPLREIVLHTGQPVGHGPTTVLPDPPDRPQEPPLPLAPSPPSAARWRPRPQRLALAVNLLLVLALGITIGIAATYRQDAASTASTASTAPIPAASTVVATPMPAASTVVTTRPLPQTRPEVPETCLDAAELADEVIARLNRNQRDNRLSVALRDYTIASQNCRRAASP
jgi:hypothetical protein